MTRIRGLMCVCVSSDLSSILLKKIGHWYLNDVFTDDEQHNANSFKIWTVLQAWEVFSLLQSVGTYFQF